MKGDKIGKRDSEWKLEIHQLDVGQGDSALVLFKKLNEDQEYEVEKSILIDGGKGFNHEYLTKYLCDEFGLDEGNLLQLIENEKNFPKKKDKLEERRGKIFPDNTPDREGKEKARIKMIEELEKEIPDMENGINASRNLFSQSQKLDAIIISHDDEDHNGGILELIKQNSPLIGENTKFIIQGGKFNGKDEVSNY